MKPAAPAQRTREGTGTHRWRTAPGVRWSFCADCGVVRQASGLHRPCLGRVSIALRETPPPGEEAAS